MYPERFQPLKKIVGFFFFFDWMSVLPAYMCVPSAYGVQKRTEYSLELDLQIVVRHHVGAEN